MGLRVGAERFPPARVACSGAVAVAAALTAALLFAVDNDGDEAEDVRGAGGGGKLANLDDGGVGLVAGVTLNVGMTGVACCCCFFLSASSRFFCM